MLTSNKKLLKMALGLAISAGGIMYAIENAFDAGVSNAIESILVERTKGTNVNKVLDDAIVNEEK